MKIDAPKTPNLSQGSGITDLGHSTLESAIGGARQRIQREFDSVLLGAAELLVPSSSVTPRTPDEQGRLMQELNATREDVQELLTGFNAVDRLDVLTSDVGARITSMPLALLAETDPDAFQAQNETIQKITMLKESKRFTPVRDSLPDGLDLSFDNHFTRKIRSPRAEESQKIMVGGQTLRLSTQVFNLATFRDQETKKNIALQRCVTAIRGAEVVHPHIVRKVRNYNRSPYTMLMPGVGNQTLEAFVASSLWAHVQRGQN